MTKSWPSWETLNAYIDGELGARESAAVARVLVTRQDLAEQVAQLSRLKAAVQESVPADPVALPPMRPTLPWPAVAAVSLLLVGILLGVLLWPQSQSPQVAETWLDGARALHSVWAQETANSRVPEKPLLLAVGSSPLAYVPDLSSARLTVSHVASVKHPRFGEIVHIGYSGTRGCRVSFILMPLESELDDALVDLSSGEHLAFAWRIGGVGHLLLADGMDPARAGLIARTLHRMTVDRVPLTEETRTALSKSRAESLPCLA